MSARVREMQVRHGYRVRTARRGESPTEPCPCGTGRVWVGGHFGFRRCALCRGRRRVVRILG